MQLAVLGRSEIRIIIKVQNAAEPSLFLRFVIAKCLVDLFKPYPGFSKKHLLFLTTLFTNRVACSIRGKRFKLFCDHRQ